MTDSNSFHTMPFSICENVSAKGNVNFAFLAGGIIQLNPSYKKITKQFQSK